MVIDRAKHYSHVTDVPIVNILNAWEKHRGYWYMNYYQDGNQPKLHKGCNIFVYDTTLETAELLEKGFRCPACGGVSTDPSKCNSGKKMSFSKSGICDWKVYGFFGDLGKGAYIFIKEKARGTRIFMPIAFEKENR